jgi:hypothetical protein
VVAERPDDSAALELHRQVFVDHLDTPNSARAHLRFLPLLLASSWLQVALLVQLGLLQLALCA